jgi:hypothetical protein
MRRLGVLVIGGVLATAASASGQVVERIHVAAAGGQLTKAIPAAVSLSIGSPPSYGRAALNGDSGRWIGPRYAASANGSVGGQTSISWSVDFAQGKNAVASAQSTLKHGWPVDLKGGVSVPHVVGKRTVGTILGSYVLTHPTSAAAAGYEAGVAFAVAPGVFALLHLDIATPASESAGTAGTFLVNGVPLSLWNRGQALWVITALELHGALPPTRVSARVAPDGRVVRGIVADAFRHPVVRARVVLQRQTGSAWHPVASTKTNVHGAYVLRGIATRGRYRTVATLGSAAVRSAPLLAGPIAGASTKSKA